MPTLGSHRPTAPPSTAFLLSRPHPRSPPGELQALCMSAAMQWRCGGHLRTAMPTLCRSSSSTALTCTCGMHLLVATQLWCGSSSSMGLTCTLATMQHCGCMYKYDHEDIVELLLQHGAVRGPMMRRTRSGGTSDHCSCVKRTPCRDVVIIASSSVSCRRHRRLQTRRRRMPAGA